MGFKVSQNKGYLLGILYKKDYSILGLEGPKGGQGALLCVGPFSVCIYGNFPETGGIPMYAPMYYNPYSKDPPKNNPWFGNAPNAMGTQIRNREG